MSESNQNLPVVGPSEADESWRTMVALFRYTTILPLLRHNRDTDGSKKDIRAAIAARPHAIPHSPRTAISVPTLRRWEKTYRQGGFEALKPKSRTDRGQSRAISSATLERAEALAVKYTAARAANPFCAHHCRHPAARPGQSSRGNHPCRTHASTPSSCAWSHSRPTHRPCQCFPSLPAIPLWRSLAV